MSYPPAIKEQAISLRQQGYSVKEIAKTFGIARSTSSLWLRNVYLNDVAKERLEGNSKRSQEHFIRRCRQRITKIHRTKTKIRIQALSTVSKISSSKQLKKLCCALLFWAEGCKNLTTMRFINSDPNTIKFYITLLRQCFKINESKLRITLHLHEYHNESETTNFWSQLTEISTSNFCKSYIKPHTGKRKRAGYMGCVSLSYFDYKVAHELAAVYNAYTKLTLGA